MTALEKTFENGSLNHLLMTLYKCQQIGIRDKFFYDALFERVKNQMHNLTRPRDFILLGVTLGSNSDFQRDN